MAAAETVDGRDTATTQGKLERFGKSEYARTDNDHVKMVLDSIPLIPREAAQHAWTFTLNTESTYDWENNDWSVPINAVVSKLVRIDKLPVQFFGGVRYWADSPDDVDPTGWGACFGMTFLFSR